MLDPADPQAFRALAHRMLDDALDGLEAVAEGPAWRAVPDAVKSALAGPVPGDPQPLADVYAEFRALIAPFETGNRHPRFFGWVHGSGTPSGILAELLAASLNANAGGREHAAVYVERAVIAWSAEIFGWPAGASGILTSGTSLANLIAVVAARRRALGESVRTDGLNGRRLTGYTSTAVHRCVPAAFDIAGFGSAALRRVPTGADARANVDALRAAIAADRARGSAVHRRRDGGNGRHRSDRRSRRGRRSMRGGRPMDARRRGFGALAMLSPEHRHLVRGIERADSLAFDFHKWLHVPYDAGCVLVRDAELHRATFAAAASYFAPAAAAPPRANRGSPTSVRTVPPLSRLGHLVRAQRTRHAAAGRSHRPKLRASGSSRATGRDHVRRCARGSGRAQHRLSALRRRRASAQALDRINAAIVVDIQE